MPSAAEDAPLAQACAAVGSVRTAAWTTAALTAFAANSLLARLALGRGAIDAASYSSVRVASGALLLVLLAAARGARGRDFLPRWSAASALTGYMVFFSFAYLSLSAGTGALILFGAVQLTMFTAAVGRGERLGLLGWLGAGIASAGLLYLLSPGLAAPPAGGAAMMAAAGVGWGLYSLCGRGAGDPVIATARNFVGALPLVVAANVILADRLDIELSGMALAAASGLVASGAGYVAWYAALRGLTASTAAILQLAVPVIAAFGGVLWLGESLTPRLVVAAAIILGGIGLSLRASGAARGERLPGSPRR